MNKIAFLTAGILAITAAFTTSSLMAASSGGDKATEQGEKKPIRILFTNVNVFDGFSDKLQMKTRVLVENNFIKEVGENITAPEGAYLVDAQGRTMTPGLIDMHQHVMLNPPEGTASYQTRWDDAAGGAFATVLSAVLTFSSTDSDRGTESGVVSSAAYNSGDTFRVVVTASGSTGSQGDGMACTALYDEQPN